MKRDLTDGFVYGEGIVRTELSCHSCNKMFVAKINFDLSGNHKIICSHCGHIHWRVIKKGVVTGDRWCHDQVNIEVPTDRMWSDRTVGIETSSAAQFIRRRWLGDV